MSVYSRSFIIVACGEVVSLTARGKSTITLVRNLIKARGMIGYEAMSLKHEWQCYHHYTVSDSGATITLFDSLQHMIP